MKVSKVGEDMEKTHRGGCRDRVFEFPATSAVSLFFIFYTRSPGTHHLINDNGIM
jgi:hypothetical protein